MRASSRIVGCVIGRSAWLVPALIAAMIAVSLPSQASELPPEVPPAPAASDPDAPAAPRGPEDAAGDSSGAFESCLPDLWVDGIYGKDTNDGSGPTAAYFTIEAAVLAAGHTPGSCRTIKVLPALYVMTSAAILTEGVSLKGVVDAAVRPTIPANAATPTLDANSCGRTQPWPGLVRGTIALRGDRSGVEGLAFGPPAGHWSALAAIVVEYPDHASIRCNVIDHRSPTVKFIGILVAGAFMPGGTDVPSDLHVEANVISGTGTGIYLEPGSQALPNVLAGADGHIVGNRIAGNLVGLVTHTTGALEISRNEIRENLDTGVSIQAWSANSVLRRNSFSDNVGDALVAAVEMDARQNWWGSPLGPRTSTITPAELQPSPMPTVATSPSPAVSPMPSAEGPQQQVAREDVSGDAVTADAVDLDPWCSADMCPTAPVDFTGTLTSGVDECREDGTSTLVASWTDPENPENVVSAPEFKDVQDGPFEYRVELPWDLEKVTLEASQAKHLSSFATREGEDLAAQAVIAITEPLSLEPFGCLELSVRDRFSDDDDPGLADVAVIVKKGDTPVTGLPSETNASGEFLADLPAGAYTVEVQAPVGSYAPVAPIPVSIAAGQLGVPDAVVLSPLFPMAGSVRDQTGTPMTGSPVTATMVADADGQPVAGTPLAYSTISDEEGRWSVLGEAGTYLVRATAETHNDAQGIVTVGPGLPAVDLQLVTAEVLITGVVRHKNSDGELGAGLPEATVTADSPQHESVHVQADRQGGFALELDAGEWRIRASAPRHRSAASEPLDMAAGENRALSIGLRRVKSKTEVSPSPSPIPAPRPQPAPAPLPEPGPSRVSGGDRTGTAASLSRSTFAGGADVVYIVASGGFADALAGGPAAAREGSPILLVNTDSLPESTRAEIERLGASRIVVLGGDGAVSPAVAAQLASLGVEVERVSGGDRFSTAAAVSQRTFTRTGGVVYIATGDGFADALSGGAAAARNRGPVLLVNGAGVPAPTEDELRRLAPSRIVVLGGSSAVPAEVAAQLDEFTEGAVERLSGSDRYATSAAIAAHGFPGTVETVYIATGENFPDALAGVPAAARERAPLLLVQRDAVPEVIGAQLGRLRPQRIVVLGGEGAVSAETARTLDGYVTQ